MNRLPAHAARAGLLAACVSLAAGVHGTPAGGAPSTDPKAAAPAAVAASASAVPNPEVRDLAAAIALGKMVFFDPRLSADGWISCGSCHQPGLVFSDGEKHAIGVRGRTGVRNAPSLLDVGQQRSFFRDGRRATLEEQALDPLMNNSEHSLVDPLQLLERLGSDPRYQPAVKAAFGIPMEGFTVQHVAKALASFERTLVSGENPFDRYLKGSKDALSPAAQRGWVVFDQKARCTTCHTLEGADPQRPLLTDHGFHAKTAVVRKLQPRLPFLTARLKQIHREGKVYDGSTLTDREFTQLGRYVFTLRPEDVAAFKTPGLRNVALTAPYMHDGSVATLSQAVDHEIEHRRTPRGARIVLTARQREDLLSFLQALTGESKAEELEGTAPMAQGFGPPSVPGH